MKLEISGVGCHLATPSKAGSANDAVVIHRLLSTPARWTVVGHALLAMARARLAFSVAAKRIGGKAFEQGTEDLMSP